MANPIIEDQLTIFYRYKNNFESDYLREPFFNWNPPSPNTIMAVCKDDVDDEHDMDEHKLLTDHNINSFDEEKLSNC